MVLNMAKELNILEMEISTKDSMLMDFLKDMVNILGETEAIIKVILNKD
jgi:hypothetical protein